MTTATRETIATAEAIDQFRAALLAAGIEPPEHIEADGQLHRCNTTAKNGRNDATYLLHLDGLPAGGYENHQDGAGWQRWRANIGRPYTPAENNAYKTRIEESRKQRETEATLRRAKAKGAAATQWAEAVAAQSHPYLQRKGIAAHGLRVSNGSLLVPMRDTEGELHSLQTIAADGTKRFQTGGRKQGCFFTIGEIPAPDGILCIVEGFATGASVHEATGYAVAVAFDAGNLLPVAQALHEKHPTMRLAICADDDCQTESNTGLTKGREAAKTVGAVLVVPDFGNTRPDGATDFNDLHKAQGLDMVAKCLQRALCGEPEPSKNAPHPLTAFKDLGEKLMPPAWLIRGVVAEGVALFAGGHGVGKTTTIAPLAMGTAGIHYDGWELAPPPEQWRHVVYITEDAAQVERIIQGYVDDIALNRGESPEALQALVRERFHLVEGVRMEAAQIVPAAPYYRKRFTRIVETVGVDGRARSVELLPLVVIDTIAATIQLDNENDNSEVSKAIAVLKQEFEGLPTWLIGHTAKANIGRTDGITARGASAWEADVNQVLYLLKEEKAPHQRVLQLGKRRFEAPHDVFDITSECSTALTVNRFGESELLTLRWATIAVGKIRHTPQAAKEEQKAADKAALRQSIIDAVQAAFDRGERLNSTAICNAIGGKKQAVVDEIKALQDEGRLLEVGIPRGRALQPSRNRFFVPLSDEEREAFKETGEIPEAKNAIPPSWCKPEKTAPNDAAESGDAAPEEQPEMPAEAAA